MEHKKQIKKLYKHNLLCLYKGMLRLLLQLLLSQNAVQKKYVKSGNDERYIQYYGNTSIIDETKIDIYKINKYYGMLKKIEKLEQCTQENQCKQFVIPADIDEFLHDANIHSCSEIKGISLKAGGLLSDW